MTNEQWGRLASSLQSVETAVHGVCPAAILDYFVKEHGFEIAKDAPLYTLFYEYDRYPVTEPAIYGMLPHRLRRDLAEQGSIAYETLEFISTRAVELKQRGLWQPVGELLHNLLFSATEGFELDFNNKCLTDDRTGPFFGRLMLFDCFYSICAEWMEAHLPNQSVSSNIWVLEILSDLSSDALDCFSDFDSEGIKSHRLALLERQASEFFLPDWYLDGLKRRLSISAS